jgi:RHS repeat-associated protein
VFRFDARFPGQWFDVETGLFQNGYRDYDPRTGRYVQSDPIGLGGGWNSYAYVGGNTVNLIDPEGLMSPREFIRIVYLMALFHFDKRPPPDLPPPPNQSQTCSAGPSPKPKPKPAPEPVPPPEPTSPADQLVDDISKATGLTGAALTTYIIISEGSRLFPPRNLVPVP